MRSQLSIRKKLKELEKFASDTMSLYLKRKDEKDETYMHLYGKIIERINALQWVLNQTNEI